jgi:hypothetical protein
MLISIEPLGTDVFLPAIVLGWELDHEASERLAQLGTAPPWFLHVMQQAGGLCMSYPECAGMLLRFEANRDHFLHDPDTLIRGLKLMAEDPNLGVLKRDYPILHELVYTNGRPYEDSPLRQLDAFLSGFLRLPPIDGGIEAFLRFVHANVLNYFRGWRGLQCNLRPEDERCGSAYPLNKGLVYYIEQPNWDDIVRSDDIEVSETTLAALTDFGKSVDLNTPIRAFLLWENSD